MSLAKVLVVVDKEVNVRDPQEAWWVALNNIDPERDARFTMGPIDVLDHSSRAFTYGSKMGIDATRKWPEEGFTRDWPAVIEMDDATQARVDAMWPTLGLGRDADDDRSAPPGDAKARRSGGASLLVRYANFVKLPHTVFALPFALVGVMLASYRAPRHVAGVRLDRARVHRARFAAMGFNRIVDRDIDARNPRTASARLPRGALTLAPGERSRSWSRRCCSCSRPVRLNPLCGWLSPVALAWVLFYSYTKRFTRWSHLVLGLGLSIAPVGGYLAVTGPVERSVVDAAGARAGGG